MLESSETLLKNYLWRYVDLNINNIDRANIKSIYRFNEKWKVFLEEYRRFVNTDQDIVNFNILLSQFNPYSFKRFAIFYITTLNALMIEEGLLERCRVRLHSIDDLRDFIGDDVHKFKLFIVCLYHYF